jgi:hypothetical protein
VPAKRGLKRASQASDPKENPTQTGRGFKWPGPFGKAILPRRGRCGRLVPDAHGAQSTRDDAAIDPVAIGDEVVRSVIPGQLGDQLRDREPGSPTRPPPVRSRVFVDLFVFYLRSERRSRNPSRSYFQTRWLNKSLRTKAPIGWGTVRSAPLTRTPTKAARLRTQGPTCANGQSLALQFSYNLLIYIVTQRLYFTAKTFRLLNKQLTLNQRVPGSSLVRPPRKLPQIKGLSPNSAESLLTFFKPKVRKKVGLRQSPCGPIKIGIKIQIVAATGADSRGRSRSPRAESEQASPARVPQQRSLLSAAEDPRPELLEREEQ